MRRLGGVAICTFGILALAIVPRAATGPPSDAAAALGSLASLIRASRDLGPLGLGEPVSLVLSLRDSSQAAEDAALEGLYDPSSPTFGHFESPAGFAARFGPDRSTVEPLLSDLHELGLTPTWRAGNPWLLVEGTAARFESAFRMAIHSYQSRSGVDFYAATTDPAIPARWKSIVTAVGSLDDYMQPRMHAIRAGGMTPDDIALAYDINPLRDLGIDGTGETVVVTVPGDGYRQENLDAFTTRFGLPPIKIDPAPKVDDPLKIDVAGELEMDLEVIHAIAPGARLLVYATASNTINLLEFEDAAVNENPNAIISQSWGSCDAGKSDALLDGLAATFERAAGQGISVFASSGDNGAYECLNLNDDWGAPPTEGRIGVSEPASVPWVTAVGGTRISLRADGTYYHETVWEGPAVTEGSGGGFSAYYPRPSWQVAPGVPPADAGAKRALPDVSADAESGMAIFSKGAWSSGGGTSQSAPIWAGITALLDQYLKQKDLKPIGFMNPALYALARSPQPYPPFHDIVTGTNLVYPATPGFDLATGLGSPDVWNLARDLEPYQRTGGAP